MRAIRDVEVQVGSQTVGTLGGGNDAEEHVLTQRQIEASLFEPWWTTQSRSALSTQDWGYAMENQSRKRESQRRSNSPASNEESTHIAGGKIDPFISDELSTHCKPKIEITGPDLEKQSLVLKVLAGIQEFEQRSNDYRVFEPLEPDHPLRMAIEKLMSADPGGFQPGSQGKSLWRRFLISSLTPKDNDYLGVFDCMNAFEAWLMEHYAIAGIRTEPKLVTIKSAQEEWLQFPELTDADIAILKAIDVVEPRRGKEIASAARVANDTVRRKISVLMKLGFVRKTKRGYILGEPQRGHF